MENNYSDKPLTRPPHLREDGISRLPDDILLVILSKLSLKEAAQTTILSHRWESQWVHVPHLHFVSPSFEGMHNKRLRKRDMAVFANLVNRVLDLRGGSSYLQEFRIVCQSDKSSQKEIDKWLRYALGLGVERLELNLSRHGVIDDSFGLYDFPSKLLHQTTKLGVQLAPKVIFSRLRELYFIAVNISGKAIEALLLKCPLLEDLRVIASRVLINVVVSGPSLLLKHLEITSCDSVESIKISDTNIVSVRVILRSKTSALMLDNLPMLTEVWTIGIYRDKNIFFSELSCCLSQLTVLTLQSYEPENIIKLYKFPEVHNLRRLVLFSNWCRFKSLIGLTSIIESCPHLVEFALMLQPVKVRDYESYEDQKPAKEESVKRLKVFEFYEFHGNYEYEHELMMFFIENGVALEKIVIDPRKVCVRHGEEPFDDERSKESRRHAVEKYKGLVPKHVEFVVL